MSLRWFYKAIVTQTSLVTWPELVILIDSNKILHWAQIPRVNILWSYLTWYIFVQPYNYRAEKSYRLKSNISRFVFPLDKGRSATFDTVLFFFIHYLHFIKAHRKEYHTFIGRNLTLILFAIIFYEYESEYEGIYHCYSI